MADWNAVVQPRYFSSSGDGCRCLKQLLPPFDHRSGRSRIESAPPAAWTTNRPLQGTYPCPSCRGQLWKPPSGGFQSLTGAQGRFATVEDMALDAIYTSAPILDYDEDDAPAVAPEDEQMIVPGAATL